MCDKEEVLPGGNVNEVVRIGNNVHRTTKWSSFVHDLLRHLEKQGFEGAPKFIGIDHSGREILSFIPGEVPGNQYPDFKPYIWSDQALIQSAALLRRYHDAVQGFSATSIQPEAAHNSQASEEWDDEVICHNDAALYNIVFRDEVPVALIDFDLAAPGPRIWDMVYMLYTSVPLASFAIDSTTGTSIPYRSEYHAADRTHRISLFFKSYGIAPPPNMEEWTIRRIEALCDTLTTGAAQGNKAYQRMIDEGHVAHYEKEIQFLQAHFEEWYR
ncbi:phosphotransferase [Paenibacillus sp. NPDC058910]|uniref:phosphotransferase n=1 Tax=unclassified Paenibacillus TaxID=185978 RepID=UPI00367DE258